MEKVIFKNLTNVKFQQLKNAIGKDEMLFLSDNGIEKIFVHKI